MKNKTLRYLPGLVLIAIISLVSYGWAAGSVTITEETFGSVKKITFDWTSSSGGAADGTTTNYYSGVVQRFVLSPEATVANQPTDLYDVTCKDDDSIDIFDSEGSNLSNSASYQVQGLGGFSTISNDKLTIHVTNAGDTKGGKVIVYIF